METTIFETKSGHPLTFEQIEPRVKITPEDFKSKDYTPNPALAKIAAELLTVTSTGGITSKLDTLKSYAEKMLSEVDKIDIFNQEPTRIPAEPNLMLTDEGQPIKYGNKQSSMLTLLADRMVEMHNNGHFQGDFPTPTPDYESFRTKPTSEIIKLAYSSAKTNEQATACWLLNFASYSNILNLSDVCENVKFRSLNETIDVYRIVQQLSSAASPAQETDLIQQLREAIDPMALYQRLTKDLMTALSTANFVQALTLHYQLMEAINRPKFWSGIIGGDEHTEILEWLFEDFLVKKREATVEVKHIIGLNILAQGDIITDIQGQTGYLLVQLITSLTNILVRENIRKKYCHDIKSEKDYETRLDEVSNYLQDQVKLALNAFNWEVFEFEQTNFTTTFSSKLAKFASQLKSTVLPELDKYIQSNSKNREQSYHFIKNIVNNLSSRNQQPIPISVIEALTAIKLYLLAICNQLKIEASSVTGTIARTKQTKRGQKFTRILIAQLAILFKIKTRQDFKEKNVLKKLTTKSLKTKMAAKNEQLELANKIIVKINQIINEACPLYAIQLSADHEQAKFFLQTMVTKEYEITNNRKMHQEKIRAGFEIIKDFLSIRRTKQYILLLEKIAAGITISDSKGRSEKSTILAQECALLRTHITFEHDHNLLELKSISPEHIAELLGNTIISFNQLESRQKTHTASGKNAVDYRSKFLLGLKLIKQLEAIKFDLSIIREHKFNLLSAFFNKKAPLNHAWLCHSLSTQINELLTELFDAYKEASLVKPPLLPKIANDFNNHLVEFLSQNPEKPISGVKIFSHHTFEHDKKPQPNKKKFTSISAKQQNCIVVDLINLETGLSCLKIIAKTRLPVILLKNPQEAIDLKKNEIPLKLHPSEQITSLLTILGVEQVIPIDAKLKSEKASLEVVESLPFIVKHLSADLPIRIIFFSSDQATAHQATLYATSSASIYQEKETKSQKQAQSPSLTVARSYMVNTSTKLPGAKTLLSALEATTEDILNDNLEQQLSAAFAIITNDKSLKKTDALMAKYYFLTETLRESFGIENKSSAPQVKEKEEKFTALRAQVSSQLPFFNKLPTLEDNLKSKAIELLQKQLKSIDKQLVKQQNKVSKLLSQSMSQVTNQTPQLENKTTDNTLTPF